MTPEEYLELRLRSRIAYDATPCLETGRCNCPCHDDIVYRHGSECCNVCPRCGVNVALGKETLHDEKCKGSDGHE